MASVAQNARNFFNPAAQWTRDALKRAATEAFEKSVDAGRAVEARILGTMRRLEIPTEKLDATADLPLDARDAIAERLAKAHATLAAVSCGAAESIPVAGLLFELVTLAEINVVQVDQIAKAYGFKLGELPLRLRKRLPAGGGRVLLLMPILAALDVRAIEREGDLDSLKGVVKGAARRREWHAITGRLAAAAALGMSKRVLSKPLRRLVPFAGSAVAAWSGYTFTHAVGEEARRYFRELAQGAVVVKGKRVG